MHFHSQNTGFFFSHSLNCFSQIQDTYKTPDALHMTFAAGEMEGAKLFCFLFKHSPGCFTEQRNS